MNVRETILDIEYWLSNGYCIYYDGPNGILIHAPDYVGGGLLKRVNGPVAEWFGAIHDPHNFGVHAYRRREAEWKARVGIPNTKCLTRFESKKAWEEAEADVAAAQARAIAAIEAGGDAASKGAGSDGEHT